MDVPRATHKDLLHSASWLCRNSSGLSREKEGWPEYREQEKRAYEQLKRSSGPNYAGPVGKDAVVVFILSS